MVTIPPLVGVGGDGPPPLDGSPRSFLNLANFLATEENVPDITLLSQFTAAFTAQAGIVIDEYDLVGCLFLFFVCFLFFLVLCLFSSKRHSGGFAVAAVLLRDHKGGRNCCRSARSDLDVVCITSASPLPVAGSRSSWAWVPPSLPSTLVTFGLRQSRATPTTASPSCAWHR